MYAPWSIAIFAHNEAPRIGAALRSIVAAAQGQPVHITVLANGCSDRTAAVAQQFAQACSAASIRVFEIPLGDKANAWNVYVHEVCAGQASDAVHMHVFTDGDLWMEKGALVALAAAFAQHPNANAVGALPTTGRDKDAWCQRMQRDGTLAGCLYALRGDFVYRVRQRGIRLPCGLIGEDWLVSELAGNDLQGLSTLPDRLRHVVFAPDAGFAFRSLAPLSWADQKIYLRRLWRYALRSVQFEMLLGLLQNQSPEALPRDIEEVYRYGPLPSRLKWVGRHSLWRTLAVRHVRTIRYRT